jgi:hypothetical protein
VTFHSRHHRLYVPYAYGALYNHPIEGFALDTLGAGLSYLLTGLTMRQSMWFFTGSTIKTVLDHGGYAFPYDPIHWVFPNNAAYHDIHHQSWGIKTNFSQPFFCISRSTWRNNVQRRRDCEIRACSPYSTAEGRPRKGERSYRSAHINCWSLQSNTRRECSAARRIDTSHLTKEGQQHLIDGGYKFQGPNEQGQSKSAWQKSQCFRAGKLTLSVLSFFHM